MASGRAGAAAVVLKSPSVGVAPLTHPAALLTNTAVNLLAFLKYSLPELLPGAALYLPLAYAGTLLAVILFLPRGLARHLDVELGQGRVG